MTYAFAVIGLAGVLVTAYLIHRDARSRERAWEREKASWAAERKELLDRIMYLADRPWETPQAEASTWEPPLPEPDPLVVPIPMEERYDYSPVGSV